VDRVVVSAGEGPDPAMDLLHRPLPLLMSRPSKLGHLALTIATMLRCLSQ
jgi:hypothetical protein